MRDVVRFKGRPVRRQEVLDVTRIAVQFYDKTPSGEHEEIVVTHEEWCQYSSKHFDNRKFVKDGNLNKGVESGHRKYATKNHRIVRQGSCARRRSRRRSLACR